jgi:predicted nucleotidyltransferase
MEHLFDGSSVIGGPTREPVDNLIKRHAAFPELRKLMDRIESVYHPADVLLFGSRARGDARTDSDWDILVVLPDNADEALLDPMLGWETQKDTGVHADVLCCYRSEFLADVKVANSRTREIVDHAVSILPR